MRCISSVRRLGAAALTVVVAAGLGACTLLGKSKDDPYDYRTAQPRRGPLEVPPDLSQLPRDERFALPGNAASGAGAAAAAAPASAAVAAVAPVVANARIEREGTQRWLAVDLPPEAAYAAVKQFWTSLNLTIARDEPALGIVETDWADRHQKVHNDLVRSLFAKVVDSFDSTGERDKYRTRIERTQNNAAEIYISHSAALEVFTSPLKDSTKWQVQPGDPNVEAEMLQRLALRLNAAPVLASAPAPAAATAATTAKGVAPAAAPETVVPGTGVHKVSSAGRPALQIDEGFDRAWRRIGLALDRGGFTVEDRDRTKGLYFVRYLDPDYEARERERRGFFARLFNLEAKVPAQQFRVAVAAEASGTSVTVQDKEGKSDGSATADRILNQISEQMR